MESRSETHPAPAHDAFISYSRKDIAFARALEKALQGYRPPRDLAAPQRYLDVFRDEEDFTGSDYAEAIRRHLSASRKLIVVCSPAARASTYVDDEVRTFAELRGADNIVPVLLSGIPNNEARPGQEAELAFPVALCAALQMPLATAYRGFDAARERVDRGIYDGSWFTILANLYDVSRSEIEQREKRRQARIRRRWITGSAIVMASLAALALWALISRHEAVRQRDIVSSGLIVARARSLDGPQTEILQRQALLAIEAVHRLEGNGGDPREANAVLADALARLPVRILDWPRQDRPPVAAFSADGLRLFRAAAGQIESWSLKNPTVELRAPLAHPISSLAASPQGDALAVIDAQGTAALYSTTDLSPVALAMPDGARAACAAFNADGRLFATVLLSAQRPAEVIVWRTADRQPHARMLLPAGAATDPVSRFAPCLAFGRADSSGSSPEILLVTFSPSPEQEHPTALARRLPALTPALGESPESGEDTIRTWSQISGAGFANDGGKLLITQGDPNGHESRLLRIDLATWKEDTVAVRGSRPAEIAPNGQRFVTIRSGEDPYVPLLKSAQSEIRDTSDGGIRAEIADVGRFSAGGARFLTINGALLRLWDLTTGRETIRISARRAIASVIESPGGRYMVLITEDNSAEIWDTGHPQELARFADTDVGDLSPDGKRLAKTGAGWVQLVDLGTDDILARLPLENPSLTVRAAPDGSRVVHPLKQPGAFILLAGKPPPPRLVDPRKPGEILWQDESVEAIAFSPDSMMLAAVDKDGAIAAVAAKDGHVLWRTSLAGTGARPQFSRDGRYLMAVPPQSTLSGALDALIVLDASTGKERWRLPPAAVSAVETDSEGKRLAVAASSGGAVGTVGIWDLESGNRLHELAAPESIPDVKAIGFLPDGKRLVALAGSKASTFLGAGFYTELAGLVWDLPSGQVVSRLPAGQDLARDYPQTLVEEEKPYLADALISADGRRLAATVFPSRLVYWGVRSDLAPKDTVVWDLSGAAPEEMLRLPGAEIKAISADGRVVLVSALGALQAVKLDRSGLAESACRHLTRNLDPQEWRAYFGTDAYRATCANISPGSG